MIGTFFLRRWNSGFMASESYFAFSTFMSFVSPYILSPRYTKRSGLCFTTRSSTGCGAVSSAQEPKAILEIRGAGFWAFVTGPYAIKSSSNLEILNMGCRNLCQAKEIFHAKTQRDKERKELSAL